MNNFNINGGSTRAIEFDMNNQRMRELSEKSEIAKANLDKRKGYEDLNRLANAVVNIERLLQKLVNKGESDEV